MSFNLTRDDLSSITDLELAFSCDRFLPAWEDIPAEFKSGNVYTETASAIFYGIFYGLKLPEGEVRFLPQFKDDKAPSDLNRCVQAHLRSFGPKHQHKIAGVGFLIAHVCEITALDASV